MRNILLSIVAYCCRLLGVGLRNILLSIVVGWFEEYSVVDCWGWFEEYSVAYCCLLLWVGLRNILLPIVAYCVVGLRNIVWLV